MRILDHLQKSIRGAAVFNPEVQVAPSCILWPDRDRQWETTIPTLQSHLPELFILGNYAPEQRTGPAIWIRCVLAGRSQDVSLPADLPPILYLPGFSRQDLRAVESCPVPLRPLAELQYRGVIWSQINAKDWTILAYLKSDQGGLGLDVAHDNESKNAMQLAVTRLLEEEYSLLQGKRLDKDYFNTLLTGGDPIRDLLRWLDQGDDFKVSRGESEWKAFVEVCKSQLAFHPQNEGVLAGAARLAQHQGPWQAVWTRYREAPQRYPNIPKQIKKCRPPSDTFSWELGEDIFDGWPQWNEDQEENLQRDLIGLSQMTPSKARSKVEELEKLHSKRRSSVWAELGKAPLAGAIEHLAIIAELTKGGLAAGSIEDLTTGYRSYGWRVDEAALLALASVDKPKALAAVTSAIRATYLPWLEDSANRLQSLVSGATYPGGTRLTSKAPTYKPGDCVLFVDGLRFDLGKRLGKELEAGGFEVSEEVSWAALPSVTATGKPAVTPVKSRIEGREGSLDFEPSVAETGQSLKGGYHLKRLLMEEGWSILEHSSDGDGQGLAWFEFGDIDQEGHNRGWKLANTVHGILRNIAERILELFGAGWKRVRVVTDHGWLLLPGGLPKVELPSLLTDSKWGRCACVKAGATTAQQLYPWYWNPNQFFALAQGICCFRHGEEYAHGGLSLQECLTLHLTVTPSRTPYQTPAVEFTDIVWKGLRCTVVLEGNFSGLYLDIRRQAGDISTTIVVSVKPFKDNGTASVVVEDEELEGCGATVVIVDESRALVAQLDTIIGGGN